MWPWSGPLQRCYVYNLPGQIWIVLLCTFWQSKVSMQRMVKNKTNGRWLMNSWTQSFLHEVNSSLHPLGRQPSADTWQGLELVCQLVPRVGREDGVLRRLRRQQDQAQRRGGANSDRHLRRETSRQVYQESSSEGSFNYNCSCSSHCRPWWN